MLCWLVWGPMLAGTSQVSAYCSGRTVSLRPAEVSYVLSGGSYKVKDVESISAAADAACEDSKLMELAWEVRAPWQGVGIGTL